MEEQFFRYFDIKGRCLNGHIFKFERRPLYIIHEKSNQPSKKFEDGYQEDLAGYPYDEFYELINFDIKNCNQKWNQSTF